MSDDTMILFRMKTAGALLACVALLAGCGAFKNSKIQPDENQQGPVRQVKGRPINQPGNSLLDAFKSKDTAVKVNRFLWTASLDVLDFLPVEAADPFTGVISTGYGRPPGGGQAYRATILVSDPALDARSLNVALQTSGGRPVSAGTQRAVEDAILTRARQLRVQAGKY